MYIHPAPLCPLCPVRAPPPPAPLLTTFTTRPDARLSPESGWPTVGPAGGGRRACGPTAAVRGPGNVPLPLAKTTGFRRCHLYTPAADAPNDAPSGPYVQPEPQLRRRPCSERPGSRAARLPGGGGHTPAQVSTLPLTGGYCGRQGS